MRMNWMLFSLISLICLSTMSIFITILTRKGYPVSFILMSIGIVFSIVYSIQSFIVTHTSVSLTPSILLLLLVISLLSVVGNFALFSAVSTAPNAGLAVTIGAGLQGALVSMLAFFFLKDKLTALQIVGIVLAIISIALINLGGAKTK